jgi:hypothetical protein
LKGRAALTRLAEQHRMAVPWVLDTLEEYARYPMMQKKVAQFIAVCRRSKVGSMGTRRHRRGLQQNPQSVRRNNFSGAQIPHVVSAPLSEFLRFKFTRCCFTSLQAMSPATERRYAAPPPDFMRYKV